jgi:hypothetical protein
MNVVMTNSRLSMLQRLLRLTECTLKIHLTALLVGTISFRPPLNPPFTGCIFFLQAALSSSLINGNQSNILFQNVLPGDCEQTMFKIIQPNITVLSNAALSHNFRTCVTLSEILRAPPLECKAGSKTTSLLVRKYYRDSISVIVWAMELLALGLP